MYYIYAFLLFSLEPDHSVSSYPYHQHEESCPTENSCDLSGESEENENSISSTDCIESTEERDAYFLFFVLDHQYSKPNLKFSTLEGQDRFLAELLRSCPFLDVHLAIAVQHISTSREYDEEKDEEYVKKERSFEIDHFINADNTLIDVEGLKLDYQSQMVGDNSKLLSPTCSPIEKEEEEEVEYSYCDSMETELSYHQAILFLWPKGRTARIYLKHSFDSVLNDLERRAVQNSAPFSYSINREDVIRDLRKILGFCKTEPLSQLRKAAATERNRALRLMKLCNHFGLKKEGLALLSLLDNDGGILSDLVAEAIAEFECRVAGKQNNFC